MGQAKAGMCLVLAAMLQGTSIGAEDLTSRRPPNGDFESNGTVISMPRGDSETPFDSQDPPAFVVDGSGAEKYKVERGPAHQWIAFQAYNLIKEERPDHPMIYELIPYLDQFETSWLYQFDFVGPANWRADDGTPDTGSYPLVEGAWEEDHGEEVPIIIRATIPPFPVIFEESIPLRSLNHFWDPEGGFNAGLDLGVGNEICGSSGPCDSALTTAQERFNNAVFHYLSGDLGLAYYWLGRTAHLLMDMSVPAHVLLDPHLVNSDDYEAYTGQNYKDVTSETLGVAIPVPSMAPDLEEPNDFDQGLTNLFYWLAQKGNDFDSDDVNGESTEYGKGLFRRARNALAPGKTVSRLEYWDLISIIRTLTQGVDYQVISNECEHRVYYYDSFYEYANNGGIVGRRIKIVYTDGSEEWKLGFDERLQDDVWDEPIQCIFQPELQGAAIGYVAALYLHFWDVTHCSAEVTSPSGSDSWIPGSSHDIEWFTETAGGNDVCAGFVDIELYKGGTKIADITSGTSNDGRFTWSVPTGLVQGSDYRIRVANVDGSGSFGESDLFSIGSSVGSSSASANPNPVNINLQTTISATMTDGAGNPVQAGTQVTFSTSHPGFFVDNNCTGVCSSPWTTTTDANGQTWIGFTSSVTGTANITVVSPNTAGTVVPVDIVNPNANLDVSISVGYVSGNASSTTFELEASVTNASTGAPVSGQRVDFTTSRGSLSSSHSFTGGTGVADVDLTVTSSGDVTVTASAGGNTSATTFYAEVGGSGPAPMFPTRTFTLNGDVNGVDFSPNGATLVAVSYGDDLKAWNTSNWSSKWSTNADDNRVGQLSISPDNNYVLVNGDGGAEVYNLSNGGLVCVAGNPAGKGILGTWISNTTYFDTSFDTIYKHASVCSGGSPTPSQPGENDGFERAGHMDYSPQKTWAAVTSDEGNMFILNSSGSSVTTIDVTSSGDNGFDTDFSTDGNKLAAVAYNVAKVYNTSTWTFTSYSPPNLSAFRYGVTFIDNNTKLAIGGVGRVEIVNVTGGTSVRYGDVSGNAVEMAWNESTQELAVGTSTGQLYIFKPLAPVDSQAPTISISHPTNNYSTNQASITTTGRVTDASGVSSFTINGVPVSLDTNGYFSKSVDLSAGSNTLNYAAADPASNNSTASRTVTRIVDTIPPVISSTSVSPSSGAPGTAFGIQTTVVDGDSGVASVTATVRNSGGDQVAALPMSPGASNTYSCSYNSTGAALGMYTVDITAVDSSSQSNSETVTSASGFSVAIVNNPPEEPSSPSPGDGQSNVETSSNLSWAGGDPDSGDTVSYDVYLEASDATPDLLVCNDASTTSCAPPSDLSVDTTYCWQVVARDSQGAATSGPVWSFTTAHYSADSLIFRDGFESSDTCSWLNGTCDSPSGAAAYYSLDEGSGSAASDSSGNSHDAAVTGAAWVTGHGGSGTAVSFSGVPGDRLVYPSGIWSTFGNSVYTEAYIYPTAYPPSNWEGANIFRKVAGYNDWWIYLRHDGSIYCLLYESGVNGSAYWLQAGSVPLNQWTKVACSFDGSTLSVLVNDAPVDSTPAPLPPLNWMLGYSQTSSGSDDAGLHSFTGSIDKVCVAHTPSGCQ